jgi:hypothetical protein
MTKAGTVIWKGVKQNTLKIAEKVEERLFQSVQTGYGTDSVYAQSVPGALFPRVRRPRREADHSPSCRAETENAWSYNFTPTCRCAFMACVEKPLPLLVTL